MVNGCCPAALFSNHSGNVPSEDRREDSSASAGRLFDILRNHFAAKSNWPGIAEFVFRVLDQAFVTP